MSNRRRAKNRGGKSRQQVVAERTSPARDGFVAVDKTRCFLVEGAFMETMIHPGPPPEGIVRVDLTGLWSRRVRQLPDEPVLELAATTAREIGQALLEGADAAERDAAEWIRRHGAGPVAAVVAAQAKVAGERAERSCRVCGCTDANACVDDLGNACSWVDLDLCSTCSSKVSAAAMRAARRELRRHNMPIGVCPTCGGMTVKYVDADTTAVECADMSCSWRGFDEEILGPLLTSDDDEELDPEEEPPGAGVDVPYQGPGPWTSERDRIDILDAGRPGL